MDPSAPIPTVQISGTASPPTQKLSDMADTPISGKIIVLITTKMPSQPAGISGRSRKGNGKLNALKHGFYTKDYVLDWEDQSEFEQLHEDFKKDWKPSGATHESCVLSLTHLTWKRRRVVQLAQIRFARLEKITN